MPRRAKPTTIDGKPIWMPVYVADRMADTDRLSIAEIGCLHRIEMSYWRSGPPPDNDETLARICGCSVNEFRRVSAAIRPFAEVLGDQWTFPALDMEMEKACQLIKQKKEQTGPATAARKAKREADRNGERNVPRNGTRNDERDVVREGYVTSTQSQVNGNPALAKVGIGCWRVLNRTQMV